MDEGKKKRREETKEVGGKHDRACSPDAYGLALVFIHRGLHLPNLLPIWKNKKRQALKELLETKDLRQKPTDSDLGLCIISFQ